MQKEQSDLLRHKKVIYIHKSWQGWGGAQQNLFDLIDHFRNEFQDVIFVCNRCLLLEKIKALKVKTYNIPIYSTTYFLFTLFILTRILIKEKPDLIHSNHRYATLLVHLLRSILPLRYKILHTARSVLTSKTYIRLLGDKTIANSIAVQKNLIKRFRVVPEKIEIIYDGVKVNRKNPVLLCHQSDPVYQMLDSSQKIIVGCFGSLVPAKGHQYLLQALAHLPKAIQDKILVLIVGAGPLHKKLEAQTEKLKLTEIVKYLGYRSDAHQIMSYCNFLVIPSVQEGLPNVLIEGYFLDKPSIVSELDYVHEILTSNNVCLIFPVRDTKKLAELIQTYVKAPELAAMHGTKGKQLFETCFSLEKNLKCYHLAYQNLLEME